MINTESSSRSQRCLHLLACPSCGKDLSASREQLICAGCRQSYPIAGGIPLLFWERVAGKAVTGKIKEFYEANPFPDYEEFDDLAHLLEKARSGVFARLLDEQIPFGTRVLDCGCGTGQLSNFLGIAHRTVIGTDISVSSLQLAEEFRRKHSLDRVFFFQMNLFEPVFPDGSFDFVICNGVLHHTADPRKGFQVLSRLVRPGGYLIVGLYHRYGRLFTDLRRAIFRVFGQSLSFLDPRIRQVPLGASRRKAWYADQYENPHESKHTIREVLTWLQEEKLEFVRSIPKLHFLTKFNHDEALFAIDPPAGPVESRLKELSMGFTSDREGGFFTIIGRRRT